jgi:hypothetical protein
MPFIHIDYLIWIPCLVSMPRSKINLITINFCNTFEPLCTPFRPKLTNAVWGAGLSFSKCHAERKVPYDPHTPNIFDGEEYSRAVRFWTWGYDVYSPHRVYVVHNYHKSQSDPKHFGWASNGGGSDVFTSVKRLKSLMGMKEGGAEDPKDMLAVQQSRYGLGEKSC